MRKNQQNLRSWLLVALFIVLQSSSVFQLPAVVLAADDATGNQNATNGGGTDTDAASSSSSGDYEFDSRGILLRVTEHLDAVMNVPVQAIHLLETFHNNQGFRPYGLHAAGRDRVLSYVWSLIQAFDGIRLYFGTEQGEYFAMFDTEAVYREPGNSGYQPENDPEMSKYYNICVNGADGAKENCTMAEGGSFVQCKDDCQLVPCLENQGDDFDDENTKWCPSYTIEQVPEGATLGFVPLGYHCINEIGLFSQEPGGVLHGVKELFDGDQEVTVVFNNGTCRHWDETPVSGVTTGPFEYCKGQEDVGEDNICNNTYTGLMRTLDYDPRKRPWYIDTKKSQKTSWSAPYPFHTHSNIHNKIGITYANPFYTKDESTGRTVFEGVFAVDYTLHDISTFLAENYGNGSDMVVVVLEAAAPNYLIGISTGASPYMEVQTSDGTSPCSSQEGDDCVTVRIPGVDVRRTNHKLDIVASKAVQAQASAGFPWYEPLPVKESGLFSASYVSQSVFYTQSGTDLEWIVVMATPMKRASSDFLEMQDSMFPVVILVALSGTLCCAFFFGFWYKHRKEESIVHGDFLFTGAFIVGCVFLNLSSLTSLGENTDTMCMTRFWAFNLSFTLAIAPLFIKVYRVYRVVGAANRMRRKKVSAKESAFQVIPILAMELTVLLVFSFVDPPHAIEEVDIYASSTPTYHIRCDHDSKAVIYTELAFKGCLVIVGCVLSYCSRNLDRRFGESKQLLFGMYNIAFTGACLLLLVAFVGASPEGIHVFRTLGVFWGTVLTCAVFVVPRLIQAMEPSSSRRNASIRISGLEETSPSSHLRIRHDQRSVVSFQYPGSSDDEMPDYTEHSCPGRLREPNPPLLEVRDEDFEVSSPPMQQGNDSQRDASSV